ncbi:MAG TPA: EAL domain-containing protein [Streptosporangiaceae bacterium]
MSPAVLAWSATWTLVAAAACVRLLRASTHPEDSVKNGYRWLAVAAVCLAAGGTVQQALGGLIGGPQPLRLADLISLAALPAIVIGLATLTSPFVPGEADQAGAPGLSRLRRDAGGAEPGGQAGPAGSAASAGPARRSGPASGIVLDSCLLVGALFAICLVTLYWPEYTGSGVGRAAFALVLIRPVADLITLGVLLRIVFRKLRLTLLPVLALVVITIGDSLAVGDRAAGTVAGAGPRVATVVAIALLALAPAAPGWTVLAGQPRSGAPEPAAHRPAGLLAGPATIAALVAVATAALVVTGYALGGRVTTRALAVTGSFIVLLLVARLAGLARQASAVAASAHDSGSIFRALADATGAAIVICDLAGTVEYVSQGVAEFGYSPRQLAGVHLAGLVHPQDRPAGVRAAVTGLRAVAGTALFAGRIRGADGSWRHVECTLSRYGKPDQPARLLVAARDVSDRVALRRELTHLTFHDGLTGLPNRAYVEDRVKSLVAGAHGQQPGEAEAAGSAPAGSAPAGHDTAAREAGLPQLVVAAILVDFDSFTTVNDLVGQAGGDLVLAQAGRRLRGAVPPPATVARWSGDEFVVLLTEAMSAGEVVDLAEHLAGQVASEPFSVAAREVTLTASVGVAMGAASAAADLLGHATVALAKAQDAGGGRVEVFTAPMQADALRRAELAGELRQAIAGGGLEIGYEPVVDLATGAVREVEAQVRWCRSDGTIPSDQLREVAEESGLAAQLTGWVLRESCRQVAAWRSQGRQVGLSVNCTLRQVSGVRLVASVLAALEESELAPQALTLEITEHELIECPRPMVIALAGLRSKGIRLAAESFGTGYASLAYLRQQRVDVVKIDSSLVAGLASDSTLALLTRTIIAFAGDLGIEVIAEGIGDPQQRADLVAMGCGLGQGPGVAPLAMYAVSGSPPAGPAEPVPAGPAEPIGADHAAGTARSTAS